MPLSVHLILCAICSYSDSEQKLESAEIWISAEYSEAAMSKREKQKRKPIVEPLDAPHLNRVLDRVRRFVRQSGCSFSAELVCKETGFDLDLVDKCLAVLIRERVIEKNRGLFYEVKHDNRPSTEDILRVKKLFDGGKTVKMQDVKEEKDRQCIAYLAHARVLLCNDGEYALKSAADTFSPRWPRWPAYKRQPKSVCPWCNKPARRHARLKVHSPSQCNCDMVELVMNL